MDAPNLPALSQSDSQVMPAMLRSSPQSELFDAQQFLARLTGQNMLEQAEVTHDRRSQQRTPLSIGIMVVPFHDGVPLLADAFAAITKDASPTGLGVVANRQISTCEVLACFSGNTERRILRAEIRDHRHLGAGWFHVSAEVTGTVGADEYPELSRLADTMLFA
jgi:hypothetical protein